MTFIFQASNSAFFAINSSFQYFLTTCPLSLCPFFLSLSVFLFLPNLMQIESFKLHFREKARSRTDHGADIVDWPVVGDDPTQSQRLQSSFSFNDSLVKAPLPRSSTTPTIHLVSQGPENISDSSNQSHT